MKELFIELADRTVRFDGVSLIYPEQVREFLMQGLSPSQIRVTEITPTIEQFNTYSVIEDQISSELLEPIQFSLSWQLPEEYLKLDIEEYIFNVFGKRLHSLNYTPEQVELAIARVDEELTEYKTRGLHDLLRVIIYVLATFQKNGEVYGVGRGSSCASFILFLLGLHVVDSIKFEVNLQEFFHD
jgi:DNA polymerase III alpha subunit